MTELEWIKETFLVIKFSWRVTGGGILLMCEQLSCTFSKLTSNTLCYSCGFQAEQQVLEFISHLMLRQEQCVHVEAWLIDPLKPLPSSLGVRPRIGGSFTIIEGRACSAAWTQ